MVIGRLYETFDALFNDLMNEYEARVRQRKVTQESAAKLKQSMDVILDAAQRIQTEHQQLEKIQNTLQYLTAYAFEDSEVLVSLANRTADVAKFVGPGGKNLQWSPTFVKNMLLVVPPAVLAEAINSIKADDWRDIIALRVVDR